MKKLLSLILIFVGAHSARTQGCVAIRNVSGINAGISSKQVQSRDKYIVTITNRYFEAPQTYRGDKYVADTLVRNKLYTLNVSLVRLLQQGWSLAIHVPLSANSRRNFADHGGPQTPKHTTRSFGLGDIRVSLNKWLFNPANRKGNIQLGIGAKLPTGDFRYQDYFFRNDSTTVLAPVDQAIQLGDGGTGITAEVDAFYVLNSKVNVFFNGFYLINPRDQNGVSNLKGKNPSPNEIANRTTVMSVPDQFTFRAGASVEFLKLMLVAAIRYEKVPVTDLIGGNNGFRRAASITSVEPGLTYQIRSTMLFFNIGIPFKRNIVQNAENNMTPAGFANYVFYLGAQVKF